MAAPQPSDTSNVGQRPPMRHAPKGMSVCFADVHAVANCQPLAREGVAKGLHRKAVFRLRLSAVRYTKNAPLRPASGAPVHGSRLTTRNETAKPGGAEADRKRSARRPRGATRQSDVVGAALAVADQAGIDRLTIRAVARVAKVPTMSLYSHFASKSELLDLMYGELVLRLFVDEPHATWQAGLLAACARIREVLLAHPRWVPLLSRPAPPIAVPWRERVLGLMVADGFTPESAFAAISECGARGRGPDLARALVRRAGRAPRRAHGSAEGVGRRRLLYRPPDHPRRLARQPAIRSRAELCGRGAHLRSRHRKYSTRGVAPALLTLTGRRA